MIEKILSYKKIFIAKTKLEQFGSEIYFLLVENFSKTFFVGGMVRDLLLDKKITDIDIATAATPDQVVEILTAYNINIDKRFKNFGVIIALKGDIKVEITTFRKEVYSGTRFPKVEFVKSPKVDAKRRDFTINSLYYKPDYEEVFDFNSGLEDLRNKQLKFIGRASKRIEEDPLRIVRGLRFKEILGFEFENQTAHAIHKNFFVNIKKISKKKIFLEFEKISDKKIKIKLQKMLKIS